MYKRQEYHTFGIELSNYLPGVEASQVWRSCWSMAPVELCFRQSGWPRYHGILAAFTASFAMILLKRASVWDHWIQNEARSGKGGAEKGRAVGTSASHSGLLLLPGCAPVAEGGCKLYPSTVVSCHSILHVAAQAEQLRSCEQRTKGRARAWRHVALQLVSSPHVATL